MTVDRVAVEALLSPFEQFSRAGADAEDSDRAVAKLLASTGWDGKDANPEAAIAAFEDALGDMLDADVEITANKSTITLSVDGEDTELSAGDLAELLETLSRSNPVPDTAKRDAKFEGKHPRDPSDGKFTDGAGGVASAGSKVSRLADRARGRDTSRSTGRAVGKAISAGTGSRARISSNGDGSFSVGSGKSKSRSTAKKIAKALFVAFAVTAALHTVGLLPLFLI